MCLHFLSLDIFQNHWDNLLLLLKVQSVSYTGPCKVCLLQSGGVLTLSSTVIVFLQTTGDLCTFSITASSCQGGKKKTLQHSQVQSPHRTGHIKKERHKETGDLHVMTVSSYADLYKTLQDAMITFQYLI